ncbi:MAG: hypothetical protein SFY80_02980 [Verrucomicrobiota bacterium]|nr:hypothetical protein [Verrucomicrobiota bacterium]
MQTTLRIDDDIYQRAKTKANQLGLSLTRFMEEAVEERLERLEQRPAKRIVLPVSSVSGEPMSDVEFRHRVEAVDLEYDRAKLS